MNTRSKITLAFGILLSFVCVYFYISPMTPVSGALGAYFTIATFCYLLPMGIGLIAGKGKINDPWFYKSAWILHFFVMLSLYGSIKMKSDNQQSKEVDYYEQTGN